MRCLRRVCPSNIPLVQYFRQEKAEIYAISMEEKRAAEAKARFEARARLEREKQARQERHKQAAVQPAAKDQDAINAARPAYARRKPPPPRRL